MAEESGNSRCRVCDNAHQNDIIFAKNMRNAKMEKFGYIHCSHCYSLSIQNVPDDLGKYYEGYYSFGPVVKGSFAKKTLRSFLLKKRIPLSFLAFRLLSHSTDLAIKSLARIKLSKKSYVLDIGCGTGQLVYDLRDLGYKNVVGVDPFLEKDIRYDNGSRVLKKRVDELQRKWDTVMLHHVFEHMENPREVLSSLKKLLKKDGVLVIRIPNVDSYAFRRFRQNWYGIQAPLHIFLPSISAMKKLVNEQGMRIEKIVGENILEFWLHSIAYSLDIWDFAEDGVRTYMKEQNLTRPPAFVSKNEHKNLKSLNKKILRTPSLCDWINYYIKL